MLTLLNLHITTIRLIPQSVTWLNIYGSVFEKNRRLARFIHPSTSKQQKQHIFLTLRPGTAPRPLVAVVPHVWAIIAATSGRNCRSRTQYLLWTPNLISLGRITYLQYPSYRRHNQRKRQIFWWIEKCELLASGLIIRHTAFYTHVNSFDALNTAPKENYARLLQASR